MSATAMQSAKTAVSPRRAKTMPTRIPEETSLSVRQVAALKGATPGDLLRDAWNEYLENHRSEFASNLELAAQMMRAGDTVGLAKVVLGEQADLAGRAAEAAAAAASGEPVSR